VTKLDDFMIYIAECVKLVIVEMAKKIHITHHIRMCGSKTCA
jgi:hypothetical protein